MAAFTINYRQIVESVVTECTVSNVAVDDHTKLDDGVHCLAIWDSGATSSIITRDIIEKLNLQPVGLCQVAGIHGTEYEYTYYINLQVPGEMTFKILEVTEGDLEDVDVLIGMDVISQGDFCISNGNKETVVAFRCPSGEPIKF
ncbi:MAG: retroviral-like aspartic protease family protein [Prevotella sp.]|nr:retroviral-like aspartic protease family protein [Prevotella sp.]